MMKLYPINIGQYYLVKNYHNKKTCIAKLKFAATSDIPYPYTFVIINTNQEILLQPSEVIKELTKDEVILELI